MLIQQFFREIFNFLVLLDYSNFYVVSSLGFTYITLINKHNFYKQKHELILTKRGKTCHLRIVVMMQ